MRTVYFLFLLLLVVSIGKAQCVSRPKLYKVLVNTITGGRINGILYDLTDSTLRYVPNTAKAIAQLRSGQADILEIPAQQIKTFFIIRKGHLGKWVLRGAGAGFVTGVLGEALLSGNNPYAKSFRGVPTFLLTTNGALLGAGISVLPRRQVRVNQQIKLFQSARQSVQKFSYQYQNQRAYRTSVDSTVFAK